MSFENLKCFYLKKTLPSSKWMLLSNIIMVILSVLKGWQIAVCLLDQVLLIDCILRVSIPCNSHMPVHMYTHMNDLEELIIMWRSFAHNLVTCNWISFTDYFFVCVFFFFFCQDKNKCKAQFLIKDHLELRPGPLSKVHESPLITLETTVQLIFFSKSVASQTTFYSAILTVLRPLQNFKDHLRI